MELALIFVIIYCQKKYYLSWFSRYLRSKFEKIMLQFLKLVNVECKYLDFNRNSETVIELILWQILWASIGYLYSNLLPLTHLLGMRTFSKYYSYALKRINIAPYAKSRNLHINVKFLRLLNSKI